MGISQEYKAEWSASSKLLFRFIFAYFGLYILLFFTSSFFEVPYRWIGKNILGFTHDFEVSGNGSGDNTYAYINLFVNFSFALVLLTIWSILDSKRTSYNRLFYRFLVVLRIFLIGAMFLYGFVKVFQIQFPSPSLAKLLQPLGELSPMGLAWTYMGYSKGFGMFAGFMELLGGLLLIPRRTNTLGALIIMGVMLQVAMMNLMFDIPVKLFSVHIVLMAGVIFMTDFKRFKSVFITNEATEKYNFFNPVNEESYHKIIFWLKTCGLILIIIIACFFGYQTQEQRNSQANPPLFYGIWEAETFIKNKDTLVPLITDAERWRYLINEYKGRALVKSMTDERFRYVFEVDSSATKISMYVADGKKDSLNLVYRQFNKDELELTGVLNKDSVQIYLTRVPLDKFPLKSRGFRWINEFPYNR